MTAMIISNSDNPRIFDVIEYIKKLRNVGVQQEVAEVQAQEMEHVIETAVKLSRQEVKNKELATKHDLELVRHDLDLVKLELQKEIEIVRKEIKRAEIKLMLLMASGFISTIGILLGVMAKGFRWI